MDSPKPSTAAPPILIEGVAKSFRGHLGIGSTTALTGLDLELRRGEIFGLLGPNGAGKTTTLKILLGLLRPDAGRVSLFGMPPADVAARARLGFLPENPYFYDHLSGEEFLDFYARLRGIGAGERERTVRSALARVGMADRGDRALRSMSKGMLQRIGLAQAIQHEPELVILDEPMSGLDPIGRREVRELILSLRDEGRTVLFSSHILQDVELLCDRVAILDRGRLRWAGELERLAPGRAHGFEVALQGDLPAGLPGRVVSRAGGQTRLEVDSVEELTRLLAAARDAGLEVPSIWPRRETLEELFLRELGAEGPARSA